MMSGEEYCSIRTLIAVENPLLRKGIFDVVHCAGFRNLSQAFDGRQFQNQVDTQDFDLILMNPRMGTSSLESTFAEMRDGRHRHHPFPITVMLLADADSGPVKKAMSSGPDDLLLMPVAPFNVLKRIVPFLSRRNPFVVTRDYTGPDRRPDHRPGTEIIPKVDVPNPVKSRANNVPDHVLSEEIRAASAVLNGLKVERSAAQIRWLIGAIGKMFQPGMMNIEDLTIYAGRLRQAAEDLPRKMGSQGNTIVESQLKEIIDGAVKIAQRGQSVKQQDLSVVADACARLCLEIDRIGKVLPGLASRWSRA